MCIFILENSRMKRVKDSSRRVIMVMKPQLDGSVTHLSLDRKKYTKVTCTQIMPIHSNK